MTEVNELHDMIGRTMVSVTGEIGDDHMTFHADNGDQFQFWYEHDCCASCTVNDIAGDIADLVGSPIVLAEEVSSEGTPPHCDGYTPDSYTWTFYRFATVKGTVTVRWFGESNGYYSESVSYCVVRAAPDTQ